MNRLLSIHVIEELIKAGVEEFILCPGARNAPLVHLISNSNLKHTYGYEERSGAFYALGIARRTNRPVAIITTSGTAAGELLPATMEAYYTSVPLVLVTADRPRRYRGSNAPQTAEQVGIFGVYAPDSYDLENDEVFSLKNWTGRAPLHLNVCFEEPASEEEPYRFTGTSTYSSEMPIGDQKKLEDFFDQVSKPLIIVNKLEEKDREPVIQFLEQLKAPVYLEGVSGIRNDVRLKDFQVIHPSLNRHDSVLRIGGVPTHRTWRDLEDRSDMNVLSITEFPFSGLSYGSYVHTGIDSYLSQAPIPKKNFEMSREYRDEQQQIQEGLLQIIQEEPTAEQSLIHHLSQSFPTGSLVYLGNSLPIRNWDLAASGVHEVQASRGMNGIDGQIATFFGLCKDTQENFAIMGDLTALYDFAAGWFRPEAPHTLFVINNRGGRIFSRRFKSEVFQHPHDLDFEHFAKFWKMPYQLWNHVPKDPEFGGLIEVSPDPLATARFWKKWDSVLADTLQPMNLVKI